MKKKNLQGEERKLPRNQYYGYTYPNGKMRKDKKRQFKKAETNGVYML